MDKKYLIVGALALAVLFMAQKSAQAKAVKTVGGAPAAGSQAALLSAIAGTQVTLANGATLDLGNGVIFDPVSGKYVNVYTGATIYG